jgi:hypothetical protein
MTEDDWWYGSASVQERLAWLYSHALACERKFRLFAAACCRRVEGDLPHQRFRSLLQTVEAFADGEVKRAKLNRLLETARVAHANGAGRFSQGFVDTLFESATVDEEDWKLPRQPKNPERLFAETPRLLRVAGEIVRECVYRTGDGDNETVRGEIAHQIRLLHDIFGPLPFRDIVPDPAWLTSDALALARGIYEEKAFDRMPILADALQDAGCDNDEMLNHCRADGWEHVRGCWVIDLLLGRPWRETK